MSDFKPKDYSKIISGAAQGAGSAMSGFAKLAQTKDEAEEAKRRTKANYTSKKAKRDQDLFKTRQNYRGEMTEQQTEALKHAAANVIGSLRGSSKKRGFVEFMGDK